MNFRYEHPFIIAGPCGAESREQTLATCRALAATGMVHAFRGGVWKPRTSPSSFQGAGDVALEWLVEASRETGLPFGVEVASAGHVVMASKHGAGFVWIGARTTVNPFMVQEIAGAVGQTGIAVLIKNPVTPDVDLWDGAVERMLGAAVEESKIGLIHRGFSMAGHGSYRNPPMWHLALEMRRRRPQMAMLCDPSHIAGRRELVADISQKAADLGYDGLMVESHVEPAAALSDAGQQFTPPDLAVLLGNIKWRTGDTDDPAFADALLRCRAEIDRLDAELLGLLSHRMNISEQIGVIKKENNVTILQEKRWSEITHSVLSQAEALNLSPEFLRALLEAIHLESINRQNKVMNEADK